MPKPAKHRSGPRQAVPFSGQRAALTRPSGRLSWDNAQGGIIGLAGTIMPPSLPDQVWRYQMLDDRTFDRMNPFELAELLADLSPDVSRAHWDFHRLANPGYECKALVPGGDTPSVPGQAVIDTFLGVLQANYGSPDVVWGKLFTNAYMRGGMLAELVLSADGRTGVDLATPDVAHIRFRKVNDPIRGVIWQLGQMQRSGFVPLDRPTIKYVPIDPPAGSPYGRPMVAPSIFTSVFLLGMLHDLRRVVAQQGYPRQDIIVKMAELLKNMPEDEKGDPDKENAWINATVQSIVDYYGELEPDDAYVHTDTVEMGKQPIGASEGGAFSAINQLIERLETMNARALKTMPILMGLSDGASEAQANRQWEILAAGIKSIQHRLETMLEELFDLLLQAAGVNAVSQFRFAELRAAELLRDAQVEQLTAMNAQTEYQAGWISQDEAAEKVVGHAAVEKEPRPLPTIEPAEGTDASETNPDPGADRFWRRVVSRLLGTRLAALPATEIDPDDESEAVEEWNETVDDEFAGLLEAVAVGAGESDDDD